MYSDTAPSLHSTLSGGDAIALLSIIDKTLSCDSRQDLENLFTEIQNLFPFDFATAALGHRDDDCIVAAHHLNISFSEEWFQEYFSRGFFQKSAVIRENFSAFRLQYWGDAWKKLRQPEEIIALCRDFGMKDGYTVGTAPRTGEKLGSLFCFSGNASGYHARTAAILSLLAPHLHLALGHLFNGTKTSNPPVSLSPREREVIHWLKEGKSSWELSVILGISERTANFHVRNIMEKLGAINRTQAVAIAVRLGLVGID